MPEKLKPVLKQLGKYKYVLLVIAVGLVLLLWPNAPPEAVAPVVEAVTDTEDTVSLERRIEDILAQAEGVGRVSVLLTLKQDMETLYAEDRDTGDSRQWAGGTLQSYEQNTDSTTVMRQDAGGGEQPLVKSRVYPIYQGALIVCDGADDAGVRVSVLESVASLTGLGFDKISVVKRSQPAASKSGTQTAGTPTSG